MNPDAKIEGMDCGIYWPAKWPHEDRYGIYAVFSGVQLIYIGKASQQGIKKRLDAWFRDDQNGNCTTGPGWSKSPTHIVTWAVPHNHFFEASALEEYLIYQFSDCLPDNTVGKND